MIEKQRNESIGDRLAKVTEELGDPFAINDIMVEFIEPDWTTGDGVFKGECLQCGAYSTMRASHKSQLLYLAAAVERYECPKNGHVRTDGIK